MTMNYASVWESIADVVPDAPATTNGDVTRTWREFDDRSARVASALRSAGLGAGSKVGLYLFNGNEYLEAQYGAFKLRAVPVNVNYRYLDDELWYLLDNSDAEALVFHTSLADRVARVVDRLPDLKLLVEVDDGGDVRVDGAAGFEDLVAGNEPMERIERFDDDLYMLYTGGTTGMPKGVMYAIGDHSTPLTALGWVSTGMTPPDSAEAIPAAVAEAHQLGVAPVSITAAPLMHGTGMWIGALAPMAAGGHIVTTTSRKLDADEMLRLVQEHRVTLNTIVGDTFARPIVDAIDAAVERGDPYDTSSLKMILSSGVMWTTEVKDALVERIPQVALYDSMGSTEGGMASQITTREARSVTAKFTTNPMTRVFKEDDTEVEPGSDEIGMVGTAGMVPLGYFKDPEKSARTFRTIDGVRYSFPGDMAQVDADGNLILLGRGSQVINSGGEKIFPEEVEEAVKRVDGVVDCLVVGVDDERFGQAVTAVASAAIELDEATVIASVKEQLAGYKAPKRIVFVSEVPRAPNGKADYKTARQLASEPPTP